LFKTKLIEIDVNIQGCIEHIFAENIEHFNAVHQTATLIAEMKLCEQRAVTAPPFPSAMTSPNLNNSQNESFQSFKSLESLRTRTASSSVGFSLLFSQLLHYKKDNLSFLKLVTEKLTFISRALPTVVILRTPTRTLLDF